ncbi:MAG TPA: TolC family outer membrane protein [Gammaproteobacteria bacterium]|nr:TolC family outer membrane protein [Gammaproteobacteria bacterium]
MRCPITICLICSSVVLSGYSAAHAADLWDVYQLVKQNTPLLRQAEADYKAAVENKPIARSGLLPQLDINASRERDKYSGTTAGVTDNQVVQQQLTLTNFSTYAQLRVTQTIFDWQDWVALAKADAQAAQAAASYDAARQSVIIQTAQAYFNVLEAQDILGVTKADEQALAKQLHQAERRYQVGLSGIVNVQQARAAHDQARASVIQKRQSLIATQQTLQALTKTPVPNLKEPGSTLPLDLPEPNDVEKWVDKALKQNATLTASKLAARVAAHEVDRQQAARYPDISLFASHNINDVSSNNLLQNQNLTGNFVGIQVSLPIFSGGAIAARSSQAKYQHVSAEAARDQQALVVRSNTVTDFRDVVSGIASVKALRESVKSSKASLAATEEAFKKASSATTLDVLRARETLLNAQTAYARARYSYLLSLLKLKQDAGALGPEDVKAMSDYFTQSPAQGNQQKPNAPSGEEGLE